MRLCTDGFDFLAQMVDYMGKKPSWHKKFGQLLENHAKFADFTHVFKTYSI
jgi:hypothetical protein